MFKRVKCAELQHHLLYFTALAARMARKKDDIALYEHIKSSELEGRRGMWFNLRQEHIRRAVAGRKRHPAAVERVV